MPYTCWLDTGLMGFLVLPRPLTTLQWIRLLQTILSRLSKLVPVPGNRLHGFYIDSLCVVAVHIKSSVDIDSKLEIYVDTYAT